MSVPQARRELVDGLESVSYADFTAGCTAEAATDADMCTICIDNFEPDSVIRTLPCDCRFYYHKECIDTWLLDHGTCPICKHDFTKDSSDDDTSTDSDESDDEAVQDESDDDNSMEGAATGFRIGTARFVNTGYDDDDNAADDVSASGSSVVSVPSSPPPAVESMVSGWRGRRSSATLNARPSIDTVGDDTPLIPAGEERGNRWSDRVELGQEPLLQEEASGSSSDEDDSLLQ